MYCSSMFTTLKSSIQRWTFLAAGFVSQGSTGGADLSGTFGEAVLGALLGAFFGLMVGLITSHLVRYFSFLAGRHVVGNAWTLYSVILGAALFAVLAVTGAEED
jgi:hypothetical protein